MRVGAVPGPVMIPVAATKAGAGAAELPETPNAEAVRPGTEPEAAHDPATVYVVVPWVSVPDIGPWSSALTFSVIGRVALASSTGA